MIESVSSYCADILIDQSRNKVFWAINKHSTKSKDGSLATIYSQNENLDYSKGSNEMNVVAVKDKVLDLYKHSLDYLIMSNNGEKLMFSILDPELMIFDIQKSKKEQLKIEKGNDSSLMAIQKNHQVDSELFALAEDNRIYQIDLNKQSAVSSIGDFRRSFETFIIERSGLVYAISNNQQGQGVMRWDPRNKKVSLLASIKDETGYWSISVEEDSSDLVLGVSSGIYQFDLRTGKKLRQLESTDFTVYPSFNIIKSKRCVVCGSWGESSKVYSLVDGSLLKEFPQYENTNVVAANDSRIYFGNLHSNQIYSQTIDF